MPSERVRWRHPSPHSAAYMVFSGSHPQLLSSSSNLPASTAGDQARNTVFSTVPPKPESLTNQSLKSPVQYCIRWSTFRLPFLAYSSVAVNKKLTCIYVDSPDICAYDRLVSQGVLEVIRGANSMRGRRIKAILGERVFRSERGGLCGLKHGRIREVWSFGDSKSRVVRGFS